MTGKETDSCTKEISYNNFEIFGTEWTDSLFLFSALLSTQKHFISFKWMGLLLGFLFYFIYPSKTFFVFWALYFNHEDTWKKGWRTFCFTIFLYPDNQSFLKPFLSFCGSFHQDSFHSNNIMQKTHSPTEWVKTSKPIQPLTRVRKKAWLQI